MLPLNLTNPVETSAPKQLGYLHNPDECSIALSDESLSPRSRTIEHNLGVELEDDTDGSPREWAGDAAPVRPYLRDGAERDLGQLLGLTPASFEAVRLCRNALILSLVDAVALGVGGVHYARDRNHYGRQRARLPHYWTYNNVMRAVDELSARPDLFVDRRVAPRNPQSGDFMARRSSIVAGASFFLADPSFAHHLAAQPPRPFDRIIIRDSKGKPKKIPSSCHVKATEVFLAKYDAAIEGTDLTIDHPAVHHLSADVIALPTEDGPRFIDLRRRYLVRISKGHLRCGGRWYHAFWVNTPKRYRAAMRINGSPVYEHDFAACHLRLAYYGADRADALRAMGKRDPYSLPGLRSVWRPHIKRAVQILFNARSISGARGAIAGTLPGRNEVRRRAVADEVIRRIREAHPALSAFWHSGCGLGLQFVDSEIVRICIEKLLDRGIVALPVHDSLIVEEQHRETLVDVMETTFVNEGQAIALERFARLRRRAGRRGQDLTLGEGEGNNGRNDKVIDEGIPRSSSRRSSCVSQSPCPPVPSPTPRASAASRPHHPSTRPPQATAHSLGSAIRRDLGRLVLARRRWDHRIMRAAFVCTVALAPDLVAAISEFHAWCESVSSTAGVAAPEGMIADVLDAAAGRPLRSIAPASVARLCRVSKREAMRVGLEVVAPARRIARPGPAVKRANRMASGGLPRIVDVDGAKPWLGSKLGRSQWYSRNPDPTSRQVLALKALFQRHDAQSIAEVTTELEAVVSIRAHYCPPARLPVDDLIYKLSETLPPSRPQ